MCVCVCVCVCIYIYSGCVCARTHTHRLGYSGRLYKYVCVCVCVCVCRVNTVGIATCYGLDGSRFEAQWGTRLSIPVLTDPEAYRSSVQCVPGLFPRGEAAGSWR